MGSKTLLGMWLAGLAIWVAILSSMVLIPASEHEQVLMAPTTQTGPSVEAILGNERYIERGLLNTDPRELAPESTEQGAPLSSDDGSSDAAQRGSLYGVGM